MPNPITPPDRAALHPSAFSLQLLLDSLSLLPTLIQRIIDLETHITNLADLATKPQDRLLTRTQAARYLNVSTRHFDTLRTDPGIEYVPLGKGPQFLQSDLDNLIAKLKVHP